MTETSKGEMRANFPLEFRINSQQHRFQQQVKFPFVCSRLSRFTFLQTAESGLFARGNVLTLDQSICCVENINVIMKLYSCKLEELGIELLAVAFGFSVLCCDSMPS